MLLKHIKKALVETKAVKPTIMKKQPTFFPSL